MNFHTMEFSEMPDVLDKNMVSNAEDILKQECAKEKNTFLEVRKTVEDIAEILTLVKEDILETTIVAEDTFKTLPVIKNDSETVTATKDSHQFVKTNDFVSDSLAGSENKAVKIFDGDENPVQFQKQIRREVEGKGIFDKVSDDAIAKKTTSTPDNSFTSRKDIRNLNELLVYLSSEDSNKIPTKEVVKNLNIPKLLSHYDEYRKDRNNNLSKLYNSRIAIHDCLEENSFITDQCRIAITHIDSTAYLDSLSEQELKTECGYLMEKIKSCKECLRSLCWNLDCVRSKFRQYNISNIKLDVMRDKFLSFNIPNEKKKDEIMN